MGYSRCVVVLAAVGACHFDAGGVSSSGSGLADESSTGEHGTTGGGSVDDASSTVSNSDAEGTAASGSDTATSSATQSEDTGNPAGAALIEIAEAPGYDFGAVDVSTNATHGMQLHNSGDAPATGLAASLDLGPFAVAGPWPGTGGTCGASLDPDADCLVTIAFAPTELGVVEQQLAIQYFDGVAAAESMCGLRGGGAGASGNLVVNGDAEDDSDPPTGWTEVAGTSWYTAQENESGVPAHGGTRTIWPSTGTDVELVQDVDLAKFADAIAAGGLKFDFTIWMRSYQDGEDDRKTILEYRDAGGATLASYDTEWDNGATWQSYANVQVAPAGTASLRIRLICHKLGGVYCDGVYDDTVLRATYP